MSKSIKYAIIAVIIVSFLFFGIYGAIASRQSYVAKVDGTKITVQKFNRYATDRRQNILSNAKEDPTRQARAVAFVQSEQFTQLVLNEMINALVISKFLTDGNMPIDVEVVAEYIKTNSVFQKEGKFDDEYFKDYIKYYGKSEYDFLDSKIPQLEQDIFGYLLSPMQVQSEVLYEEYAKALKRVRDIKILTINTPEVQIPSDDILRKIYEQNKHKFIAKPQHYVTLSYVDEYIKSHTNIFNATPNMIAKYYNKEYMGRVVSFYYAKFTDESQAKKARLIVKKQGISLQSIIETMLKNPVHHIADSGKDISSQVNDSNVLSVVKDLSVGSVTDIVQIGEEFYLAQILNVHEEEFSHENIAIGNTIAEKRRCNNARIYVEKIKEELQAGVSFEGVVLKYGLPISQRAVINEGDRQVYDANTNKPLYANKSLVEHILNDDNASYGHVVNIDDESCSYVVYKKNKILNERFKTLPEVRGEVISIYQKDVQFQEMEKTAKYIVEQISLLNTELSEYKSYGKLHKEKVYVSGNSKSQIFQKPVGSALYVVNNGIVDVITINNETQYGGNISKEDKKASSQSFREIYYKSFLGSMVADLYKNYNVEKNK